MRMLEALARKLPEPLTRQQLATLSGCNPNGGGFRNTLSAVFTAGLVEKRGDDVASTSEGLAFAGSPPALRAEDVQAMWRSKLLPAAWRMVEVLLDAYPEGVTHAELAARCDHEVSGGGFRKTLSALASNELVDKRRD